MAEAVDSREGVREAARELAEEGFTVVPAHPVEKRPIVKWQPWQDAEPPEGQQEYWLNSANYQNNNYAIITGKQIVVVDADSDDAVKFVRENLTYTPRRVTTSKGKHFYYQVDPNYPVRNGVNPDLRIDLRGQGGCVIAPGSIHESGHIYARDDDPDVDVWWGSLPKLCAADLRKIKSFNEPAPGPVDTGLSFNVKEAGEAEGNRNHQAAAEAGRLFRQGLSADAVLEQVQQWNTYNSPPLDRDEVERTVNSIEQTHARNSAAEQRETREAQAEAAQAQKVALEPKPFVLGDASKIPPRQWVYGRHYIRKFLSVTVAPGGTGKTAITLAEAVAMATGRSIMGVESPKRRVWVWNLEDPLEELQRRIAGIAQHHNITQDDLGDRLLVNSGRDEPLIIAEQAGGANVLTPAADALTNHIKAMGVDVVIVDPFVSSHHLSENDNKAIDMVVKRWAQVANDANCSIELVHHVRKGNGMQEATVSDARGASALVDAARHVRRLQRMTAEEARNAGIDEDQFWRYSREGDSKDNLAPPTADSTWRQMVSVELPNGDSVGVSEPWAWPDAFSDVTRSDLESVQRRVASGEWRENPRAKDWVGIAVAEALNLDASDSYNKAKIRQLLKIWIENGALRVVEQPDKHRKMRAFICVGQWMHEGEVDE